MSYTVGASPNIPALTYQDTSLSKAFPANKIHANSTELGMLVSIALELTVDAGSTTFSFFLPTFDEPQDRSATFTTIGIYKESHGVVTLPENRKQITWRVITLAGTAETVELPLSVST